MAKGLAEYVYYNEVSLFRSCSVYFKQSLDEVEHDIMNYQNLVSVLSAEAEGTRF